jgi:hypothetical protein
MPDIEDDDGGGYLIEVEHKQMVRYTKEVTSSHTW